ncbi:MAG: methyltransferase domain-containing protein [Polyangiaceae bacterium]|nr:methyltransferase domain-containing protein [Polyangiaceae bacterium]
MGDDPSERARADNANWFDRAGAFDFLETDRDNVVRLEVVQRTLARERARRGERLLDVGAGDGRIGARLAALGYQVTALDGSERALALARERGLVTVLADASRPLPFEAASFDVVYAGELIEHLFDTSAFLLELRRVLRPGGLMLLTTPNLAHLPDRLRFLVGKAPTQVQPLHPFLRLHIRPFGPDTLRAALAGARLRLTRLESTLVVFRRDRRDPERVTWASRTLARWAPSLGSFLIAAAERDDG